MPVSKTIKLADELEKMINEQYTPGDSFFTASQLAAERKISGTTANNVLKILEHRRLIIRSQRKGAVIAPREVNPVSQEKIIILLSQASEKHTNDKVYIDEFIIGIQNVFPNATITITTLDANANDEAIVAATGLPGTPDQRSSYILWSVPLNVQRFFAASKLPCVIYGTKFPSIPDTIRNVECDTRSTVQLIRNHLLGNNRSRFACLLHSHLVAGDILILDEFQSAFANNTIYYKFLPFDELVYEHEINRLLETFYPDALICQTELMANVASRCCRSRGIIPGQNIDIVLYMDTGKPYPSTFPHVVVNRKIKTPGQRVAGLLKKVLEGKTSEGELIPVQLVAPSNAYTEF
ncbi:MAG: GntR family transcriptional regulator [Planctomycetia bacterium]|nr:GntR family transcriptional regulator [Planctomycetia bacterium]